MWRGERLRIPGAHGRRPDQLPEPLHLDRALTPAALPPQARGLSGRTVLLVANEPWGDVWYSKHHYAVELARENCVFFVNAPVRWTWQGLMSARASLREVMPRLSVLDYLNPLPVGLFGSLALRLNDLVNSAKLARLVPVRSSPIFWQFDPLRFLDLDFLPARRIYHVADDYSAHPNDGRIATRADLVCCTSRQFLPHYQRFNRNVVHVPHGVSDDEFEVNAAVVAAIRRKFDRFVFYAGGIEARTNLDLFARIAHAFQEVNVVLAGPDLLRERSEIEKFALLKAMPNVKYLGPVPGNQLKSYIHASAACLVMYRFGEQDRAGGTSSHKVVQYLAQRRIVVSTLAPEPAELAGKILYSALDAEAFLSTLSAALAGLLSVDHAAVADYLSRVRYSTLIGLIGERLYGPAQT